MHPWMALWIWSMTMSRIAGNAMFGFPQDVDASGYSAALSQLSPTDVRASDYLQSDVTMRPLPGKLLDRLADLYWTERDSELAI